MLYLSDKNSSAESPVTLSSMVTKYMTTGSKWELWNTLFKGIELIFSSNYLLNTKNDYYYNKKCF
jgi:hypothetical protein